nr:hypothetical protein [uncultured Desulfuromusa sp.]
MNLYKNNIGPIPCNFSGTTSYEYDNNGNTTKKTEGTGSQGVPVPLVTTYHYNAKNRFSQADLPDGRTATYSYDPFGRHVSKTVETTTTYYLYADEGLIGEYSNTGSWQKSYGWKPNGLWLESDL